MTALRLLYVAPFFAWRFGGSVEQLRLQAGELARAGHCVTVLTTDLGVDARDEALLPPGVQVLRAPARGLAARPPYRVPRPLSQWLDDLLPDADVVATATGLCLVNVAAERRARALGVPFVYVAQGALQPERLRQKRLAKALFLRLWERPLLRAASAVQALNAAEAEQLQRHGASEERICIVPNGIDPAPWQRGDAAAARQRLQMPQQRLVVFLGRLAPEKGLPLMLAAAAPLLREQPDLRLVLAGPDGGERAALQRQVHRLGLGDCVLLPGPVPPELRADLLAAATVFAHTSLAEGQPLSVLEAAAAGCPLWLTTGCNLPEVAAAGAGTVDPPQAAALTASLRRLLASADGEPWRGAARRLAVEQFSLASTTARLAALYRRLAAARQR